MTTAATDKLLAARYKRAGEITNELAALCPETPSVSWSAFLAVRWMLIQDFRREGKSDEEIAQIVSADAAQIERIRTAMGRQAKGDH